MAFSFDIRDYESPLALLDEIIKNKNADLFDLPISEISRQYVDVLRCSQEQGLDMELASEFILMAASLTHIKIRMLLPDYKNELESFEDSRQDLVIQLMAYRRMKRLAENIEERYLVKGLVIIREPLSPKELGVELNQELEPISLTLFERAVNNLQTRNEERYNQQNVRILRILKKDRFSIKDTIKKIFSFIRQRVEVFFHELFPVENSPKSERISGFLAVLELVHKDEIWANQPQHFGSIELGLEQVGRND